MKLNQKGLGTSVLISTLLAVVAAVLLVTTIIFYGDYTKYKNNDQTLINTAVSKAQQSQSATDAAKYSQERKSPYRTFNGPSDFGNVTIKYPRTWSAYVNSSGVNSGSNNVAVDGYFMPGILTTVNDNGSFNFALRVQIINQLYSQVVQGYQQAASQGVLTASAYAAPNVPKDIGTELTGQIQQGQNGELIILPMGSSTLVLWTEGNQYTQDFNNIILKNLTFNP